jgi:uncharacterized protein YbcI
MAEAKERGGGANLREVTDAIVGIHHEYYGRGATSGRTIMQGNYLVCFMHDIYTKAERTLIEAGKFDAVLQARHGFQDAMRVRFSEAVERLTDRKVVGFLSQVSTDPDISLEAFVLDSDHGSDGSHHGSDGS